MAASEVDRARAWFAVQAAAGVAWWVGVAVWPALRDATLGGLPAAALAGPDLVLFSGASAAAATGRRWAGWVALAWTAVVTVGLWAHALVTGEAGWGALAMGAALVLTTAAATTLGLGALPRRWFTVGPFSFRPAPARSPRSNLVRSLAQLVVFWTAFFLGLPVVLATVEDRFGLELAALDRRGAQVVGAALLVAFSGLGLWSCLAMSLRGAGTPLPSSTARRLVVVGPYRHVRNPMAVAGVAQSIGVGLLFGSWLVVVCALAGAVVWDQVIRPEEERDLAARFGDDFARYRDAVDCWVPRLSAW
ncbi:isoprenylcysteine carboxylmethyltransferase family protein [Iamia majanohamensis]|uniref:Isoprenylcysteine carboxylmethyltransferase family protein n=1 Tax=Iamia majanohamensis TaxID=467976 RepID=A0AAE9Y6D1_9ACTN|nr:isoprenylcysteine carboxylmethyltransferase family protein [Iamia majanohamensis]WCO67745.1 isoprenylcysteine carboxylmethyltransferase family protein [Iamia majanohamensis]